MSAFPEFRPCSSLREAHMMTVASFLLPRRWRSAAPRFEEQRRFRVDAENEVMARCHWQPDRRASGTVVLVHGLSGSDDSKYMMGTADKAYLRGFNVLRLNIRNCGGTEHLAATLYHSGMSEDLAAVLRELRGVDDLTGFYLAGFSMGGNIVLRLAGQLPDDLASHVAAVAVVSPSLDLAGSVWNIDHGLAMAPYRATFLRHLRSLYRRKAKDHPAVFDPDLLRGVRSVFEFDDRITAKYFGFDDAQDYYRRATALTVLEHIGVDTLVIQSKDDPLLKLDQLQAPGLVGNKRIETLVTAHGGHCAFIGQRGVGGDVDRFWAENRVVQFFGERVAANG